MQIGIVFPQNEIGTDPLAIRDYAQTAEGLGYTHILAYDHVLGANPDRPEGFKGPYTYQSSFHEPFVLYSYIAAITQKIGLVTGVIILPQRQTALVAKQAATLDVLSNGRVRLGIGTGWNKVEYDALGENFHDRGKRSEEQIAVLRALWTQELVVFKGKYHDIPDAGLKPLPVQRPIPIWLGGSAPEVLKRIAKLGDGWMPNYRTAEECKPHLDTLDKHLAAAGRTRAQLGIEPRIRYGDGNPETWHTLIRDWEAVGATHLTVITEGAGFDTPQKHIEAIRNFARVVDVV
ncbi:MAG TPA: LLM class F420-dependent oxidoreductase [Anaerolineales bacterium]|nr:LLM class F420-dependent oxidoreductase [Anaerolineales bacterium]